jgi:hypothetical protein
MSIHHEYLVRTYIAGRQRVAQDRLPRCSRDASRQEVQRIRRSAPYRALT